MGSSSSTPSNVPPQPLAPLPENVGCIASLCFPYEVTLVLKEQVGWSGDSFSILDINKTPCFTMKGRAMSFTQKKVLHDMQGQAILNFRHELAMFEKKYSVYAGSDQTKKMASIKAHSFMGISASIEFTNINGQPRLFTLDGNFFASRADIVDPLTGMIVGRIARKPWNSNQIVWGKQTYTVTIAPNVDIALIICICVALDETKHDK